MSHGNKQIWLGHSDAIDIMRSDRTVAFTITADGITEVNDSIITTTQVRSETNDNGLRFLGDQVLLQDDSGSGFNLVGGALQLQAALVDVLNGSGGTFSLGFGSTATIIGTPDSNLELGTNGSTLLKLVPNTPATFGVPAIEGAPNFLVAAGPGGEVFLANEDVTAWIALPNTNGDGSFNGDILSISHSNGPLELAAPKITINGPLIERMEDILLSGAGTTLLTPTTTAVKFSGTGGAGRNIEVQSAGAIEGQVLKIFNTTDGLITVKQIDDQVELNAGGDFDMGNISSLTLQFRIRSSDNQQAWVEMSRGN